MAKAAVLDIVIEATADKATWRRSTRSKRKAPGPTRRLKVGAVAAAGAVIAGLGEATNAVRPAARSIGVAKLEQAYKNAGVSTDDDEIESLEEIDKSSRKTGQSTEDNIAALHETGDRHPQHHQGPRQDLAVAQDLAAYKGISVASAADAAS